MKSPPPLKALLYQKMVLIDTTHVELSTTTWNKEEQKVPNLDFIYMC